MKKNNFFKGFLYQILLVAGVHSGIAQLALQPHYFDFGPVGSEVQANSLLITPKSKFTKSKGYGWLKKPEKAFVNDKFSLSRDALIIDGVEGQKLDFKATLPAGEWWITFYADAGYEDASTMQVKINGEAITLDWHGFQPPAEPYKEVQTSYRVHQSLVRVTESLHLSIEGGDYEARLLGVSLIPKAEAKSKGQLEIMSQLSEAGKYGSIKDVDGLLEEVRSIAASNPADPFYAYWSQYLDLLSRAELHFQRRGWEEYVPLTGLSIWGQLHQAVMILDGLLNHTDVNSNPLYERSLFLRGRVLYWLGLERGGPNEIRRGAADLAALYRQYPSDDLLAMYNGKEIDLPDPCDDLAVDPNAPVWSTKQRELLCRMRNIAHWWVLEQQAENGEFGGKIGDDVELLRWWTPVLLSGDSLSFEGWARLADGVFNHRKVRKGYSKKPLDVEHASEFIADTAPMMVVCSDESLYLDRLKYSVDYFMNLWTGRSVNGNRFFRSAWFSSTEVDERPPRNRDQGYNSRAVKAVRYYVWKTQDEEAIKALNEWSDAWLRVAMRTDKGKPVGVIPASVRFPDESFNGDEKTWYRANMFWKYFEWEATPGSKILDQLLFSYTLTQDEKYLAPLIKCLELIKKYDDYENELEEGSEAWAANILKEKGSFWGVAAQWRFLTGDQRFDNLLKQYGTPYFKYRLTGDEKYLEEGLDRPLRNARYNTPLKTYEAIHTDRVYIKGYEHLTTMLTGNGSNEGLSPHFAVTWEKTTEDFTSLVQESTLEKIKVAVYSHSDSEMKINMRLWQLDPGEYQVLIGDDDSKKMSMEITKKGQRLALSIPSQELYTVEITKSN